MSHITIMVYILAFCYAAILIYRTKVIPGKGKPLQYFMLLTLMLSIGMALDTFNLYFNMNIEVSSSVKKIVSLFSALFGTVWFALFTIVILHFIYGIHKIKISKSLLIILISIYSIIIIGYLFLYSDIYITETKHSRILNSIVNDGSRIFLIVVFFILFLKTEKKRKTNILSTQNRITLFYITFLFLFTVNKFSPMFINYNTDIFYFIIAVLYLSLFGIQVVYVSKYAERLNLNVKEIDIILSPISMQMIEDYNITSRELEIIKLIIKGKTNNEISEALFITCQTVKDHNSRIFKKFNVKSRVKLIQSIIKLQPKIV